MHYFQGVPAAIVPDNLKSAVIKSSRFEPTINETFADLADHYGTSILPARAYKPRDKSLVEGAVKILYRRIYAHLKETPFYSLAELNQQIWDLLKTHNDSKLTARPYSRKELFLEDEKQKLHPLPEARFELKYQSHATVMQNGHVLLSQEKIGAAYGQFKSKLGNLGYQLGLRVENTNIDIDFRSAREDKQVQKQKEYTGFFPSAFLS